MILVELLLKFPFLLCATPFARKVQTIGWKLDCAFSFHRLGAFLYRDRFGQSQCSSESWVGATH